MAYAIRNDGLGWRAIDSHSELMEGEYYSDELPVMPDPEMPRIAEIKARLAQIDLESVRPLRAVVSGTATEYDHGKLASIDAEVVALRAELAEL